MSALLESAFKNCSVWPCCKVSLRLVATRNSIDWNLIWTWVFEPSCKAFDRRNIGYVSGEQNLIALEDWSCLNRCGCIEKYAALNEICRFSNYLIAPANQYAFAEYWGPIAWPLPSSNGVRGVENHEQVSDAVQYVNLRASSSERSLITFDWDEDRLNPDGDTISWWLTVIFVRARSSPLCVVCALRKRSLMKSNPIEVGVFAKLTEEIRIFWEVRGWRTVYPLALQCREW